MNKALFWDFDGTLTQHRPLWTKSAYRALELAAPGCGIGVEDVRPHLQAGFTWHTPEVEYTARTGDGCWWEDFRLHLLRVYTALGLDECRAKKAAALVRELVLDVENYTLYDDAIPTLKSCAEMGYSNYVLSNNYPELPETAEKLGLAPYFSGCVVSALVGYEKPRREIFEIALDLAGRPDVCCMIGDNPVADIAGAQAAGMPAILVHNSAESTADYACGNLAEVVDILKKDPRFRR